MTSFATYEFNPLDTQKFRKWNEIDFFDRVTHFRETKGLYKWVVVVDTLMHQENIISFELRREYDSAFIDPTQSNELNVTVLMKFTILGNGALNILAEERGKQRFRVRDVPGILDDSVFKFMNLAQISEVSLDQENNFIRLNYKYKHQDKCWFNRSEIIHKVQQYEVIIDQDDFSLRYYVGGELRLNIPQGSFVFETEADTHLISQLLEISEGDKDQDKVKRYQKLLHSTHQSYEFKGIVDNIPQGPTSTALTFEWPRGANSKFEPKLMGIPSRIADTLDLLPTKDGETNARLSEPHRLFSTDHFHDDYPNMSLYGVWPVLYSIESTSSTGIMMLNASDGLVDILKTQGGVSAEWTNESGVLDLYIFSGDSIEDNARYIIDLTGKPPQPLETSLGYNQCRWNYFTQDELLDVNEKLTEHSIPTDFLWLDIEHTDSKMYFTFDKEAFPDPEKMLQTLIESDRKLVTQIDPHFKDNNASTDDEKRKSEFVKQMKHQEKELEAIKKVEQTAEPEERELKTHYIAVEAIERSLVVLNKDGENYSGDCWPGNSVYIDYLNHEAQKYFGDQYLREEHLQKNAHVHAKNDMNEPSVFSQEYERTMPKNNIHIVTHYVSTDSRDTAVSSFEHRDVHNLYGILMAKASYEGMIRRTLPVNGVQKDARAFLLTRAFYVGSQKYGAMWIGDSSGNWNHLRKYIPIWTTISMAGFSFCGFDTPGFYLDPTPEFFVRGYQLGCMFPFFRAHADRETKRREPYLFKSPFKEAMIRAIETRYELVMYYYTAFFKYRTTHQAIMRPVIDYETGTIHRDQVFIGDSLMGKAFTKEGMTTASVFLPCLRGSNIWYRRHHSEKLHSGESVDIECAITENSEVPIFVRGGSVIPEFYDLCKNK